MHLPNLDRLIPWLAQPEQRYLQPDSAREIHTVLSGHCPVAVSSSDEFVWLVTHAPLAIGEWTELLPTLGPKAALRITHTRAQVYADRHQTDRTMAAVLATINLDLAAIPLHFDDHPGLVPTDWAFRSPTAATSDEDRHAPSTQTRDSPRVRIPRGTPVWLYQPRRHTWRRSTTRRSWTVDVARHVDAQPARPVGLTNTVPAEVIIEPAVPARLMWIRRGVLGISPARNAHPFLAHVDSPHALRVPSLSSLRPNSTNHRTARH